MNDIRKFEEIGTHPAAEPNAISEALVFNENIGIARKTARLRYLRDRWAHRLRENAKVQILHSESPELSAGIGFIGFKGVDAGKMYEMLYNKHNIVTAHVDPCRANMTGCASRRTSIRPCAMSTPSPTRWRRNSRRPNPLRLFRGLLWRSGQLVAATRRRMSANASSEKCTVKGRMAGSATAATAAVTDPGTRLKAPIAAAVASRVRRLGKVFVLLVISLSWNWLLPFPAMTNPRRRKRVLLSGDCGGYRNLAVPSGPCGE